ncbi:MAG: hypothetical protein F4207_14390 [Gemmatimonadetes bacterium]|nr:hypothetical protein [Gemmatimonadota bacterium]MYG17588.1 hypothetical protein [Gemmatimonadota bacterium]
MNVPGVRADQLLALSQASDEVLRSVYHRDRHATLRSGTSSRNQIVRNRRSIVRGAMWSKGCALLSA